MANNIDAFLKARGKNHTEDVRLQHILETFEMEKRQWERRVFNETYEQRKQAYNLKRESDQVMKRKKGRKEKRKGEKYEMLQDSDNVDGGNSELPRLQPKSGHADIMGNSAELFHTIQPLPAVQQKQGKNSVTITVTKTSSPMPQLPNLGSRNGKENGSIIITGSAEPQQFADVVETLMTWRKDEKSTPTKEYISYSLQPSRSLNTPRRPDEKRDPTIKKVKLADVVARLFPKSLRRARSMADLEILKENPLLKGAHTERTQDGPEYQENVHENPEDEVPPIDPDVLEKEYWIGDPKAIGSVRRARLPPEVMSARSKNVGEVMKLIRDLPVYPSCTRNCNKPGASFEEVAGEQQNMLPSLVIANVARHYLKTSRASSLETLTALTSQVVHFPAVQDSTFAAPTVQKKIEKSMEEQRQSLKRAQRELTNNAQAGPVKTPALGNAITS